MNADDVTKLVFGGQEDLRHTTEETILKYNHDGAKFLVVCQPAPILYRALGPNRCGYQNCPQPPL